MPIAVLLLFIKKHARAILAVALFLGTAAGLYGLLHHENTIAREERVSEIHRLESEQRRLIKLVTTTVAERDQLKSRLTKLESRKTDESKSRDKQVLVERYDPTSGKLVEKRTSVSRSAETRRTEEMRNEQHETEQVKTKTVDTHEVTREDTTKTTKTDEVTKVVIDHKAPKRGVGVGVLATTLGVGPAISYQMFKVGPVGIDGVLGVADGPLVGAQASMEAPDSITVGAGMFAGFDGPANAIQWGKVDVVPGVTVQYRF